MVADPNNNSVFWTGGEHDTTFVMAVSKTTDCGMNWQRFKLSMVYGYTFALAVDPTNSDIIYAGGHPALFKTTNGGLDWEKCSSLDSDTIYTIAINRENSSIIYIGSPYGVFKSSNGGIDWSNTGCSGVNEILIDPDDADIIYVATHDGVYKSTEGGGAWIQMNDGLHNTKVTSLAIDPGNYLYAGTDGGSIYRWPLGPGIAHEKENQSLHFSVYPNPTRHKTKIRYSLARKINVNLCIYDIQGRMVKNIISGVVDSGNHTLIWDGCDVQNRKVTPGIYFCMFSAGQRSMTKKIVLLK